MLEIKVFKDVHIQKKLNQIVCNTNHYTKGLQTSLFENYIKY